MEFRNVLYEKNDGVAWITKNHPTDNAMVRGVMLDMDKALDDAADDPKIRVVVVSAAGDGFHGGGGPFFTELSGDWSFTADQLREYFQFIHRLPEKMDRLEKPIIGVAKGGAIGGSMEHLHACDFVIAADTAIFSQPEPRAGMVSPTQRLTRIIGWRKAKELMMGGYEINGEEAERIGMVNKAVPLDEVDEAVDRLITDLKKSGPVALGYTKLCMLKTWETDYRTGLEFEREAEAMCFASGETRHGVSQFLAGKNEASFEDRERHTSGSEWK